jgi:hypothetical protein
VVKNPRLRRFFVSLSALIGLLGYFLGQEDDDLSYSRSDFKFKTYSVLPGKGFYTGVHCEKRSIDHVVSLRDAYDSGASKWPNELKQKFANDRMNHVPACAKINSAKGALRPFDLVRVSNDQNGIDFTLQDICSYLELYWLVKKKYNLSTSQNDPEVFKQCGVVL